MVLDRHPSPILMHDIFTDTYDGSSAPLSKDKSAPRPSVGRSSLITGIAFIGTALLNYLYAAAMAWLLPVQQYGVLGLAQAWIMIAATLLGSGFPVSVSRAVASQTSTSDMHRSIKTALIGNIAIACGFSIVLVAVARFTNLGFGTSTHIIFSLLLVEVFWLALTCVWTGMLQGLLQFGPLALARLVEIGIKVLVGVAFVMAGFGVTGAVTAWVLGTALSFCIYVWSARHLTFWKERSWGNGTSYRGSLMILLGLSALTIITQIDVLGLKILSPAREADTLVGYYQAASMLPRVLLLLAGTFASVLFPYITAGTDHKSANFVSQALKYVLLLVLPAHYVLITMPEAIITLIFPHNYIVAAEALRWTAGSSALLAIATILTTTFHARGRVYMPAIVLPLAVSVQMIASWLLVPTYGIVGAGVALFMASAFTCGSLFFLFRKYFPLMIARLDTLKYLVVSATFVSLLHFLPHHSRQWTVVTLVVALSMYALLLALSQLIRPADVVACSGGVSANALGRAGIVYTAVLRSVAWLNNLLPTTRTS